MKNLKQVLKGYWAGLKHFLPTEEDEASLVYAYREYLERYKNDLTFEQRKELEKFDKYAIKLWQKNKDKQGEGPFYLELLIKNFIQKSA